MIIRQSRMWELVVDFSALFSCLFVPYPAVSLDHPNLFYQSVFLLGFIQQNLRGFPIWALMKTNVYDVSWTLGKLLSLITKGLEMEEETHWSHLPYWQQRVPGLFALSSFCSLCFTDKWDFLCIWTQFILSIKKRTKQNLSLTLLKYLLSPWTEY